MQTPGLLTPPSSTELPASGIAGPGALPLPVRSVQIAGVGGYAPSRILTNHDLERTVETSDEWIQTRTGIRERRIAAPDEASSDLALRASRRALENAGHRIGLRAPKRPEGTLARRRERQHMIVLGLLVALLVVGFLVRPDWPARLAFVVIAVLAYPVLRVLLFKRV